MNGTAIRRMEDVQHGLEQLSDLCNVLASVGECQLEPRCSTIGNTFLLLRDLLDQQVQALETAIQEAAR